MNGLHDMGGMQCYGPVDVELNEPIFHAEWEKKALALTLAMGFTGMWNLDKSRNTRELLPPGKTINFSYYQIWLSALENLITETGLATEEEIRTGKMLEPPLQVQRVPVADQVPSILRAGASVERTPNCEPLFVIGQLVKTLNFNPKTHTRLPRYARGKRGRVIAVQGYHVFPDSNAVGTGEHPQWIYNIAFKGEELFGNDAEPETEVILDCWEPYLEPADG